MRRVHSQRIDNVEDKNFKCDLCDYACLKSYYLKCHIDKFHNGQSVKNEIIPVTSLLSPNGRHKPVQKDDLETKRTVPRICKNCCWGFLDEESFTKHIQECKKYICKMCSRTFKYAITFIDHTKRCRNKRCTNLIKSEKIGIFKCTACSSNFRKAETLEAHVNGCDGYNYLKLSNSIIHGVNERESFSSEKVRALAGNEGSNRSEMKMNQEDGDSNQLTLEETCSTLLNILETVADK
jgi:hypothetical protein